MSIMKKVIAKGHTKKEIEVSYIFGSVAEDNCALACLMEDALRY